MTMEAVQTRISMEDYLEMEYASMERHEFVDGKIRPMPYASENHREICSNLNYLLQAYYRERNEHFYTNQTLVFFNECERGYYPDATIFPPEIEYRDYRGKMKAALNPLVVIEVLSESTEHIDRGEKWLCYQTIPSLRQYVLVSQNEMKVEIFTRQDVHNEWLYRQYDEKTDEVKIGESSIPMQEIYRKVDFEKVEGENKND